MRRLSPLLWASAWSVAAGAASAAALRVVAWDRASLLVGWNALGPLPYLVVALPLVGALLTRRWALAVVTALTLLAAGAFGLPEVRARRPVGAAERAAPGLSLLTWNLNLGRGAGAAAAAISREHPDLVLLQEVTPASLVLLRAALDAYPSQVVDARPGAFGSAMASVFPLEGSRAEAGGLPLLQATLQLPTGSQRVVNVHTRSPVGRGLAVWSAQFAALQGIVAAPGPPLLLAGDFNADWGNEVFRQLLRSGLTDAAAARGQIWSPTWPADSPVGPLLRLDHVLTSAELTVLSLRRGGAGGSDHRGLRARIVRRAPAAGR